MSPECRKSKSCLVLQYCKLGFLFSQEGVKNISTEWRKELQTVRTDHLSSLMAEVHCRRN